MKRSFIFLIKFMPVIQMAGMLFANTLYYFNNTNLVVYSLNYLLGNSFIVSVVLFICSYLFGFCKWHRLIITANFINITITTIDGIFTIPISFLELIILYYSISILFIIIALIYKFKCKKYETSIEDISQRITQCCR